MPLAREADLRTLEGFMGLWTLPGARTPTPSWASSTRVPFALLAAALVALRRRRRPQRARPPPRFAAMLGAGVTTQVLKPLLATQRDFPLGHYMGPEAYPSGHTTAVMSFALALVIVAPPRWRPLAAAAGGLLTVGTVYSILILGSHYPSDVIGGFLVATGWALPSRRCAARRPSLRRLAAARRWRGAVLAAAGPLAVVAAARRAPSPTRSANTTFVAGALAIAAAALRAQR